MATLSSDVDYESKLKALAYEYGISRAVELLSDAVERIRQQNAQMNHNKSLAKHAEYAHTGYDPALEKPMFGNTGWW